jgi:dATP pyrophosphohydrolase
MTKTLTDIVDVYVFRRLNARVQFLLVQRRSDVPMARTWQAFHHEIADGATAADAARRAVESIAGLGIDRFYSADFINQFYDEARDAVVLAPVLAVTIVDQTAVTLSHEFEDAGWFDRDEATARLPFSGQRWAVRHIDEIMSIGETETELYRFHPVAMVDDHTQQEEPPPHPENNADDQPASPEDGLEPRAERQSADAEEHIDNPDADSPKPADSTSVVVPPAARQD